uniref:Uncharacterized protein n=1 Tax=Rhizophagus irregularis (strain DAOM 181602 / DAOM 197198 / MUCL 43194) TaxID=747089 RepID=U9UAX0_RHIID
MQQALASNLTITGDVLKSKALNFATRLQITSFTASDGWQINRAGEANSAPLETLEEECKILQEIIEQYDPCDVYNVDETADNAPTHLLDETIQLSNIKVYFLPPNTTAHLQPLDAGIINSFKAQYRKLLIANRIEMYDLA